MNKIALNLEPGRRQKSGPSRGRKICIVTGELAGPFFNGGIGTANRALALVLRSLGHELDILYTHVGEGKPTCLRAKFEDHVEAFRALGINLKCIDHPGNLYDWQARSYLSLQHLLQHQYDIVFFDDMDGTAYYPLLARRTASPALRDTLMCVTAHSSTQWLMDLSRRPVNNFESLRLLEMERRSIELADAIKAPSTYILRKYRSYGWKIPENCVVLPNFISEERRFEASTKRISVEEIVFFGRLETRKGLWMFCRALDRVKGKLCGRKVAFLGKMNPQVGEALIKWSATWPFTIRLLNHFDQHQALAYLKGHGRLAVIGSPEDNSPSTIIECLEEGIPFLACSGSGGEELLSEQSRKDNLFGPSVNELCAKLIEVFERGAVTAHSSLDQAKLRVMFAKWLDQLRPSDATSLRPNSGINKPVLIVLIPPEFLATSAVAELLRIVRAYDGNVDIHALAADPAELRKELEKCVELLPLTIDCASLSDFEKVARSVAACEETVAGLCHISQPILPIWASRARECFANEQGISAVTGMVASSNELNAHGTESGAADGDHKIERYLMGYAPPLFPLMVETNSGFLLLRSHLLTKCSSLSPYYGQYDRLKRMQNWVHEILVTLHLSGERFELVPDQVVEQSISEASFEAFDLERFMRSGPKMLYGFAPGSEQHVLTRLAIDIGLERERSLAHTKYVNEIAERIGSEVVQFPVGTSFEAQVWQFMKIAYASGQIDLAIDLGANAALPDASKPLNLTDYIQSAVNGEIINIVEALADRYEFVEPTSYKDIEIWGPWARKINMHLNPDHKSLIGLRIPLLDLRNITHFTSLIELQERTAERARFRIELISCDKKHYWSTEQVLNGGDAQHWEFECPETLRTECTLQFGVELPDRQTASKSAVAQWINPRFIRA